MPIRFLMGVVVCFAVVAAGLVNPEWYFGIAVQVVCCLQFLYAIELAINQKDRSLFPLAAFVFMGVYMLIPSEVFGSSMTAKFMFMLSEYLHPAEGTLGKPILFDDWNVRFETIGRMGASMLVATLAYFLASIYMLVRCKERYLVNELGVGR